jgi:YD repeat-containing protein
MRVLRCTGSPLLRAIVQQQAFGSARSAWARLQEMQRPDPQLAAVIRETARLWRKARLDYDQSRYVVERVRQVVQRLSREEVERPTASTPGSRSTA